MGSTIVAIEVLMAVVGAESMMVGGAASTIIGEVVLTRVGEAASTMVGEAVSMMVGEAVSTLMGDAESTAVAGVEPTMFGNADESMVTVDVGESMMVGEGASESYIQIPWSPRSAPIDEVYPWQCPCLRAFESWCD
jgi:hypothetical protein